MAPLSKVISLQHFSPSMIVLIHLAAPLHHPPGDHFKDFDDEANLIGSLHLDADDEPRRMGATSRANSVRFDESANQGHWSHASRSSMDFMPRSTSSLGGIPMNERTSSHKSDGRASSVHSVRSAASGRASSLNLDTSYGLADPSRSPPETPGLAPGLLILGSVPSIIRCWMNTDFKHNSLLYAAICSASHKSYVDIRLLRDLGFEERICDSPTRGRTIELPVYFPEAVPHPTSSRSSSPAPQVPALTVEFNIVSQSIDNECPSIQVFIGSDTLRTHNADIMFSTNSMTVYDDDQCKLSIPLVRPENEAVFNTLYTAGGPVASHPSTVNSNDKIAQEHSSLNGLGQKRGDEVEAVKAGAATTAAAIPSAGRYRPPGLVTAESRSSSPKGSHDNTPAPEEEVMQLETADARPSLSLADVSADIKEDTAGTPAPQSAQSQGSPAIWSNWRRETPSQNSQFDWTGTGNKRQESGYQRRDTGIKVLKPMKAASRSVSGSIGTSAPPADGKSRFFDDGKRRGPLDGGAGNGEERKSAAPSLSRKASSTKENQQSTGAGMESVTKTRTNPVGGASAFSWLNSGGSKS